MTVGDISGEDLTNSGTLTNAAGAAWTAAISG